jgi:hypothetical protein
MGNIWGQIRCRPQYVLLKFNVLDYGIQFKRGVHIEYDYNKIHYAK